MSRTITLLYTAISNRSADTSHFEQMYFPSLHNTRHPLGEGHKLLADDRAILQAFMIELTKHETKVALLIKVALIRNMYIAFQFLSNM